jgi:hypothetical protein
MKSVDKDKASVQVNDNRKKNATEPIVQSHFK